ncbi:ankyrin repeat-containing domain protein, partial [Baffinella frigidus]
GPHGITPLHLAAHVGMENAIVALLALGANIEAKDLVHARTPLHLAAQTKMVQCVHTLMFYGARVDAVDNIGKIPLD